MSIQDSRQGIRGKKSGELVQYEILFPILLTYIRPPTIRISFKGGKQDDFFLFFFTETLAQQPYAQPAPLLQNLPTGQLKKRYSPTYEYGTLTHRLPSGQPLQPSTAKPVWVGQSMNSYVVPTWAGLRSLRRAISHGSQMMLVTLLLL